ncbi:MAG TPA: dihydrolipoyl dehydrogenase [Clostridia bacterium]|nr:dihydrolipoyl dehydrogenase [Clostridia bacterium]
MDTFDLIVLGGGPAGYLAAERAAQGGMKVAVFEKRDLGGVCLNEGCIPSKALLNSAKVFDYAAHGEKYGVVTSDVSINQSTVIARKNKVVKQLVAGVGMMMKKLNITVVNEPAMITGKGAKGFTVAAAGIDYATQKLLIATGSVPMLPPIPGLHEGLENGFVLTNREILDLEVIPESLVVVGGGAIGLEMASYFNSVGAKVTVIEMLDKIAGQTDNEISDILLKNYKRKKVDFKLSCKVTSIANDSVTYEEKGESKTIAADKVLISIGRKPFVDGIGLESIGVYTERGAIVTDDHLRTNVAGVYAAGDVNGKSMLAHTAYRESEVAVNHMLGKRDTMRYNTIAAVIYTTPEVAGVGETEESAKAKGMDVQTARVSMRMSGRYMAEVDGGNGIAKLVVDKKYNRLVGVHLIGSYASEIIYGAALMIETEMPIDDLKELVFPHPTVSEVIREALFEL